MPRFFALCGLSFSGKTTLAKAISGTLGAQYVGVDDITEERGLFGGNGISGEEWEKTSRIAVERLSAALDAGRDVVLDDTLCFRWLRDRYEGLAGRCGAEFILIHVCTPLSEIHAAIAHNTALPHRNPIRPDVFEAHASSFEFPSTDERPLIYDRSVPPEVWIESQFPSRSEP